MSNMHRPAIWLNFLIPLLIQFQATLIGYLELFVQLQKTIILPEGWWRFSNKSMKRVLNNSFD